MKLYLLTPSNYPSFKADPAYMESLACGMYSILGDDFRFVPFHTRKNFCFKHIAMSPFEGIWYIRIFWSIFWTFVFCTIKTFTSSKPAFMTSSPYILYALLMCKILYGDRFILCSDWHMIFKERKTRLFLKYSDVCITTSRKLKKHLESIYPKAGSKIFTVYGGVNLNLYSSILTQNKRNILLLPNTDTIIGYVGGFMTMGMSKGLDFVIDSLLLLPSNIMFACVGGQKHEVAFYKEYAKKIGVDHRVIFVGRVDSTEISSYQRAMDMLVIPYPDKPHFREWGFPMKVYEYMASGLPIIYSKLDLVEEVLSGGGYGYISDSRDDFVKKVHEAILDKKKNIKKVSVDQYSWENKAKTIIAICRGVTHK